MPPSLHIPANLITDSGASRSAIPGNVITHRSEATIV
jgi:hypothetical protein